VHHVDADNGWRERERERERERQGEGGREGMCVR